MKFQQKKVATALAYALGVGGAALVVGMPAQAADIKVDVTGSNIKRVEAEGASEVLTITNQDIVKAGYQTLTEYLQTISAAGGGLDDRFTNGFAPGAGGLNLRNLGFNSTLILVNGRRLPTYPFAQILSTPQGFNDLNSIPLQAIDRVDVLLDGASAIYGADAVAGVVNIILKKDFTGVEAMAGGGTSYKGDGSTYQASITGGWGDLTKDKFNVMLNANYYKRQEILSADRNYAKSEDLRGYAGGTDLRSSFGNPGTLFDTVTGDTAFPGGCGPTTQIGGSSQRGVICRYDRPLYSGMFPETERYGFFGQGQYNFSPAIQAFVEASWARNNYFSTGFPAPTLDGFTTDPLLHPASGAGLIVPVGNPYNPFPNPAEIRLRTSDVGTRDISQSSDIWRVVAGLRGTVKAWDWEAAYYQSEITTDQQNLNQVLQTEFQKVIDNGTYNLANPLLNPASVTNALRFTAPREGKSTLKDGAAKISGDLMQLPAGPLSMAFGGEYRKESLSDVPSEQLAIGNTMGISASQAFGSRNVGSVYAEFNIPVVKTFEANVAARYDDYTGNGAFSGTSPKLGLRWQPTQQLLLRGTVGQAYRAPSLFETTPATQTAYSFGLQDPVLCPVFNEANPQCSIDLKIITSGNPNLKPEKTNFYTAGIIFEPVNNASFGVDYWNFDRTDEISGFTAEQLLAFFPTNPLIVPRNPNGTIANLNSVPINLNKTKTSGLDFTISGKTPSQDWGQLGLQVTATYVIDYKISYTAPDGSAFDQSLNGTWGYPRVRANWALNWTRGPWNSTLSGYFIDHQFDDINSTTAPAGTREIGSYAIWNLGAGYTGFKNWNLRASVQNLFNTRPPFVNYTTASQGSYDPTLSDPVGTFFNFTATYTYK